jgi:hypothetical protein
MKKNFEIMVLLTSNRAFIPSNVLFLGFSVCNAH